MTEGKTKVAIYARVSTTDQTPENQVLDLRRYCAARGWTVVKEFIDVGISGAKADRPALGVAMEAIRERQMDCLLVWRYDRFARSLSHLVTMLDELQGLRIGFASRQEGIDTNTPGGKMVFGVLASLAEFERAITSERVLSAHRRHRAKGGHIGRPLLSEVQRQAVLALRGAGSVRRISTLTGVSKTIVAKWLSVKSDPTVASHVD